MESPKRKQFMALQRQAYLHEGHSLEVKTDSLNAYGYIRVGICLAEKSENHIQAQKG